MKNKPLAFQIWVVISGILLAISILLLVLFSNTLRNFFTDETYTTIENEQHVLTEYRLPGSIERGILQRGCDRSDDFPIRSARSSAGTGGIGQ